MKKILFLIAFIAVAIAYPCMAGMPGNTVAWVGVPSGNGSVDCPSFYDDSILSWDGDYPSDTDAACETDGDSVQGTVNGSPDIGTSYGESGSVGIKVDASGESISYTDSGGVYADLNGARTVWMRIYFSAVPTGDCEIFHARYDGDNNATITVKSTAQILGYHESSATYASAYGAAISPDSWVDVAYSWDLPNRDHSANTSGSWEDDNDELSESVGTDVTDIYFGSPYAFSMGAGEYYQITQWAIVNGYKTACPW